MTLESAVVSLKWHQKNEQQQKNKYDWTSSKLKTLVIKGQYQDGEKTTYRIGEHIWNSCS